LIQYINIKTVATLPNNNYRRKIIERVNGASIEGDSKVDPALICSKLPPTSEQLLYQNAFNLFHRLKQSAPPIQRQGSVSTTAKYSTSNIMRPPYIDPETQVIYDTNNPEYEGWLTKQSMWLKDWRRRYFILKNCRLFFCKSPYEEAHGMIDLSQCNTVKSANLKSHKLNSFEISTGDITYLLYADAEKEKDDWIGVVGRSIVTSSRTFVRAEKDAGGGGDRGKGAGVGLATASDDESYDGSAGSDDNSTNMYYYK